MSDHESSRAAFEVEPLPGTCERSEQGWYHSPSKSIAWEAWCRALDYAASRECVWDVDETEYGIRFHAECGHSDTPNCKGDVPRFCRNCGGRVKIQEPQTTTEE